MNTLEKRIESLEKSAKRWKIGTAVALLIGLACGAAENARTVTFDEVRAKRFIGLNDDGSQGMFGMKNGAIVGNHLLLTSDGVNAFCRIENSTMGGTIGVYSAAKGDVTAIIPGAIQSRLNGKVREF